jgi:hypothetical protein
MARKSSIPNRNPLRCQTMAGRDSSSFRYWKRAEQKRKVAMKRPGITALLMLNFRKGRGDGGDEREAVAVHGIAVQVEGRDESPQREPRDGVGEEADLAEVLGIEEEVGDTILHPHALGDVPKSSSHVNSSRWFFFRCSTSSWNGKK